ncbi:MAG: topoisomerase [Clostridiales bacterium]|nr:topoisomerase [Clostridiales bacterium]
MKALVIAEKPSVGRDIARVLKCNSKQNGFFEGQNYIVTWGLGHLVELAPPEEYNKEYREWKMEHLPIMPDHWKLEVIKQTGKQFNTVKTQIHRSDVAEIIIATDAGREGELVARLILEKSGNKKPIKRLWISSVTDKAIKEGFSHLKSGADYIPLYHAAMARAKADWLVGMNATRALTCKYNAQLSCGRVQTPTLAMIAKREEEIRSFIPKSYYRIVATDQGGIYQWKDKKSNTNATFDKAYAEQVLQKISGHFGVITRVDKQPKKSYAPLLYDLTELQRDANRLFNYSAKETLNIMQRLYENHKVLTYPRTDSRYITSDIVATIPERLQAIRIAPYKDLVKNLAKERFSTRASYVNDAKVSDHHAIIPTEQYVDLSHMTIDERKIYDLVVKRFLAVLYPPYEYEQTTAELVVEGESFTAKGDVVKQLGWKEVYDNSWREEDEEETDDGRLPELPKGQRLDSLNFQIKEGKTKPPAYFNEGTLLSAMENPVKYMETKKKEDIKILGETGGLGTVATRADIIEKLFASFLIEKKGKDILVTSKGKQLLELVPDDLRRPEMTAQWERKLLEIAKGKRKSADFMNEIASHTKELLKQIKTQEGSFRYDNITNKKCPDCGKRLLLVNAKNSKKLVCQDRECGYRETISRVSNARCPVCHKKMELVGKDEKQQFTCSCGHKEKLDAFTERRKSETGGASKKDVAKFLNQQKKEAKEPVNNALANALSNLKL